MKKSDTDEVSCGVFDTRNWQDKMPMNFKSSDTVYMAEIPDIVREAFDMNQCQQSMENYDYLTTAAAGMLEGCALQKLMGESKKESCVGDNWH